MKFQLSNCPNRPFIALDAFCWFIEGKASLVPICPHERQRKNRKRLYYQKWKRGHRGHIWCWFINKCLGFFFFFFLNFQKTFCWEDHIEVKSCTSCRAC